MHFQRVAWQCRFVGLLVALVGVVLAPPHAVAATVPVLVAYDTAVQATATTRVEGRHAVRSEAEPCGINDYDGARLACGGSSNSHVAAGRGWASAYGDPTNPRVAAGTAAVRVDDGDLDHLHRRELRREGVICDAPTAATAAKGGGSSGGSTGGKPNFQPNPAHTPGQPGFNPGKTVEPGDSAKAFENAIQGKDGNWYGQGGNSQIYRYFPDNTGGAHFSGMTGGDNGIPLDRIPIGVRRVFGMVR